MLLMVCAGAEAQYIGRVITASSQLVSGNTYVVRVSGGSYFTDTGSSYSAPNSQNSITDAAIYYFYTEDGGSTWKIKNYSTGKYWGTMTGSGTGASNTFVPAEESGAGSYQWNFSGTNVTAQCGSYYVNRSSGTMHSYTSGLNLQIYEYLLDKTPSIPSNKVVVVETKTTSITAATSATDNNHWYLISQTRDSETPLYTDGTQVVRAASSITPASLSYQMVSSVKKYLVRFFATNDGLFYMQFGDGTFIKYPNSNTPTDGTILAPTDNEPSGVFAFTLIEGATTFSWNLSSATGKRVDNNGQNATVVYYSSGTQTTANSNCDWGLYPVTFSNAIPYSFTATDGSFYHQTSTYQAAGESNYANRWLSKSANDKPQLKLISNSSVSNSKEGNNMRSSGGLYTTATSHRYNLSISEGRIISYTIVGTAVGALGITPEGGSVENFAASASVSKKVTLDSPAKETYFNLSGSSVWLNVEKFLIEYESDATDIIETSEITNDGIYTILANDAKRGALYANTSYLDACGGYKDSSTWPANPHVDIDATNTYQQFAIYTYSGNKYLYNIGSGKFVGVIDNEYFKLNSYPTTTWSVSTGSVAGTLRFTHSDEQKLCVNAWVGDGKRTYGVNAATPNDGADNLIIKCVSTLTNEQKTTIEGLISAYLTLDGKLQEIEQYTIGNDLGEYTNVNYASDEEKISSIASIRTAAADYSSSEMTTATSDATTVISNMTLNIPATNGFYRIKGYATNKYAKAGAITADNVNANDDATSLIPNSVNTETDGSDIWFYDATNHLINYKNGLGTICTRAFAALSKTKETITFAASTCSASGAQKIGLYEIKSNYKDSKVWYSNTNNVDRNNANNHVNCEWVVEAVPSLPVTISSARYATLYAPVALEIPSGVKAFSGTVDKAKSQLTMHRIEDVIPANTAVVLKLEDDADAGTFNFNITTTESTVEENSLQGTTAAQTYADEFVLGVDSKNSENIGFFKLSGSTVLPGFKAYLPSNVLSDGARSITMVWDDETTGISDASRLNDKSEMINDKQMFDLQGRRVSNPQRGLYIVNGHKIVIK